MDHKLEHEVLKKGSGSPGSSGMAILDTDLPEKRANKAWKEVKNLPFDLVDSLRWENIRAKGYPLWRRGDLDAFFALWGDNLATQLTLLGVLSLDGVDPARAIAKIMPGIGLSMIFGNLYYALQASKLAHRTGRTYVCSQPYGVNTPGALMKCYAIFLPVFYKNLGNSNFKTPNDAFDNALEVATACNLASAMMEIVAAFILPFVADRLSSAALLAPLAGIGITWLGAHQIQDLVRVDPMVGLLSLAIVWYGTFGGGKLGTIPISILSITIGTILAWSTRATRDPEDIIRTAQDVNFYYGSPGVCFMDWSGVGKNLTLLLPIALTNALGTLQCVRSAQEFGDDYSSVETMVVDGLGTFIGACFGSPVGTTVYLGHPAYKKMGASRGYGLLNGVIFFVIGITGSHGLLNAIIPRETVVVVVMFVGFMIAAETVDLTPKRWRPAVILGMMIPSFDWVSMMVEAGVRTALGPVQNFTVAAGGSACPAASGMNIAITPAPETDTTIGQCIGREYWKTLDIETNGNYLPGFPGVSLMKNGGLFISLLWTLGFISITDRKMLKAGCVWCVCSVLSVFGVIHSNKLGIPEGSTGTGATPNETGGGWMFISSYLLMAVFCFLIHLTQRLGLSNGPICRSTVGSEVWNRPKEDEFDDDNGVSSPSPPPRRRGSAESHALPTPTRAVVEARI